MEFLNISALKGPQLHLSVSDVEFFPFSPFYAFTCSIFSGTQLCWEERLQIQLNAINIKELSHFQIKISFSRGFSFLDINGNQNHYTQSNTHCALPFRAKLGRQTCFHHRLNPAPMQKSAKIQVITFFLAAGNFPGCLTEHPALTDQMGTLLILHR